ncbi:MAG: diguanylate cyclase [Comamonadaceae bacterium]|nr:diguanylate cyclase [Comamonadaceae bacterium]
MRTRVFLVEDEAVIAMDLCERLTALGYEVCGSAAQGETAVQGIAELRPALVLMDVNLAGSMDGVEVAQQLRERYDVPVVFLTAYSDPELIARVSQTSSYGYLVKPFEERELHATLQVALARHATERELREQITVDSLTGLHNRRFLDQLLPIEISRARRGGRTLSVIMIDIDNFKLLNDAHGHDAGDHVLQRVASTLRGAVRASDLACRYGGDEFTVVMPGVDARGAAHKIRSICAAIRENAFSYRGAHLTLTLSAGVAEIPAAGASPEDLLHAADAALYRAKQAGRDRVCEEETGLESS